jgi:predicted RNase H-like HicB family nuclease
MNYKVVLEQSDEGFAVSVPGLPGCHSQGKTESEALVNIADAIREYLAVVDELTQGKQVRQVEVAA